MPATPWRNDAGVIGLVGLAHCISHFSQLLLAPLFPWLKDAFQVSYTQLGFLLTIFFVVSCVVQTLSGFWVDRFGPRPILFGGLRLLGLAALGYASSQSYGMLAAFSVVAGVGNGVFHPVDYTLINRRVARQRLGHAYSVHGITGSLGWALAPALLVPSRWPRRGAWRWSSQRAWPSACWRCCGWWRGQLQVDPLPKPGHAQAASEHSLAFLKIPAVWMCFGLFFFYAGALSIVQTFAPQAARELHAVPAHLVAICLSVYMVCSAGGMLVGGFMARDPQRAVRTVGVAFGLAAMMALAIGFTDLPGFAVPMLFGAMGFVSGTAGPSRDLLVKASAPDNATGRVYGVVYSGLDIGQAVVPLVVGRLMDRGAFSSVWLALALLQGVLIASAFNVRRVRRTQLQPASA